MYNANRSEKVPECTHYASGAPDRIICWAAGSKGAGQAIRTAG